MLQFGATDDSADQSMRVFLQLQINESNESQNKSNILSGSKLSLEIQKIKSEKSKNEDPMNGMNE